MDEEVLVFPSEMLSELGGFRGFSAEVDRYLPVLLAEGHLSYRPRSAVEDDPSYKQVVPYVVLRCGDAVYCYRRGKKGGEARLHDLWSLGIGGHIRRQDGDAGSAGYRAGFLRELNEEVAIGCDYGERIVGMVHDDSTPVGAVHFGIVHLLELERPEVEPRDQALDDAGFRPMAHVLRLRSSFESWSVFVIARVLESSLAAMAAVLADER